MSTNDLFAIIPIPTYGSSPANALAIGPLDVVMQNLPDTHARTDSIRAHKAARIDAMATEQRQKATRALQIAAFADSVNSICKRMDALEARRSKKLRQIAAQKDAAEQKQIADYLNTLPDPDNPPASHVNTGDLSPLPPTNTGDDNEGDLPAELSRATPPPPGNYPLDNPAELDEPLQSKYRQPIAVSLNEDDY
jgi:hypothetical protein